MTTNAELWERRRNAAARGVNTAHPDFRTRAQNAQVWDIVKTRGPHAPDADRTKRLMGEALNHGSILLTCGLYGNGVRILVPLTVEPRVLEEGLNILEDSLKAVA